MRFISRSLAIFAGALLSNLAAAQDVPYFKPQFEATKTPTPAPPAPVYSFSMLEPVLQELCSGLERDGRRVRLVEIAEREAKSEKECISCRSFWKSFVAACLRAGPKKPANPKAKPTFTPARPVTAGDGEGEPEGQDVAPAETPPPSPTPKPTPRPRYPSTEFLDGVSRISTSLYAQDPGDGSIYLVLDHFVSTVSEQGDFTVAEREYYDILTTYLMSAWQGRNEAPRHYTLGNRRPPPTTAPASTPVARSRSKDEQGLPEGEGPP